MISRNSINAEKLELKCLKPNKGELGGKIPTDRPNFETSEVLRTQLAAQEELECDYFLFNNRTDGHYQVNLTNSIQRIQFQMIKTRAQHGDTNAVTMLYEILQNHCQYNGMSRRQLKEQLCDEYKIGMWR